MTRLDLSTRRPGSFARWAQSRAKVRGIVSHLRAGGSVRLVTYTRAVEYGPAHVEWFKATRSGAFVRRGKSWDCIDTTGVLFSRLPAGVAS